jgi:hypothetical protein
MWNDLAQGHEVMGREVKVRRLTKRILGSEEWKLGPGAKVYVGPPGVVEGSMSYLAKKEYYDITGLSGGVENERLLLEWITRKSSRGVRFQVSEYATETHLLLRDMGFVCVAVARGDIGEDDYIFRYA